MKTSRSKNSICVLLVLVIAMAICAANIETTQSIDLYSCRIKIERAAWPFRKTKVLDSYVSSILSKHEKMPAGESWVTVSRYTLTNKKHSPHFRYHSAIHEMDRLKTIASMYHVNEYNQYLIARAYRNYLSDNVAENDGPSVSIEKFIYDNSVSPEHADAVQLLNEHIKENYKQHIDNLNESTILNEI